LPWDEPQFHPLDKSSFKSNAVLYIIDAFLGAAKNDKDFLAIILEANFLGLLRPFLQQEFHATPPYMAQRSGDRLMVYDSADFALLAMIREHGLKKLLPPIPDRDPNFFDLRRTILSRALNTILPRDKDEGEAASLHETEYDFVEIEYQ
jgi:hypothetical protein